MLILKFQFKDVSNFFRKVDLLKYAEFNINISFINKLFVSKRPNTKSKIKSCKLYKYRH